MTAGDAPRMDKRESRRILVAFLRSRETYELSSVYRLFVNIFRVDISVVNISYFVILATRVFC